MSCICPGHKKAPPGNQASNCISSLCASGALGILVLEVHPSSPLAIALLPWGHSSLWSCAVLQRSAFPAGEQLPKPFTEAEASAPMPNRLSLLILGFLDPFPCSWAVLDIIHLTAIAQVLSVNRLKKKNLLVVTAKRKDTSEKQNPFQHPSLPGRTAALTCAGWMFRTVCWSSFLSGVLLHRKFSSCGVQKSILEVKSVTDQHDSRVAVKSICVYWQRRSFHRKS